MPRTPRLEFPGARHHVMNRGARKQPIFLDDRDCRRFLALVAELPERYGVRIHGYAVMPNHFHLLVESERGELSRAMRHVGGEYARRLNLRYDWDGPVWKGRFRNRVVDSVAYWRHLLAYVHLNPERAGLAPHDRAAWTSHAAYVEEQPCPGWLTTDELRGLFGSARAYAAYVADVAGGRRAPPESFDADALWEGGSTRPVPRIEVDVGPLLVDCWADVEDVTGLPREAWMAARWGRGGSPATWLAVWWASRCGVDHGLIASAMRCSHSTVSRRIARVRRRRAEAPLRGWIRALERRRAECGKWKYLTPAGISGWGGSSLENVESGHT